MVLEIVMEHAENQRLSAENERLKADIVEIKEHTRFLFESLQTATAENERFRKALEEVVRVGHEAPPIQFLAQISSAIKGARIALESCREAEMKFLGTEKNPKNEHLMEYPTHPPSGAHHIQIGEMVCEWRARKALGMRYEEFAALSLERRSAEVSRHGAVTAEQYSIADKARAKAG